MAKMTKAEILEFQKLSNHFSTKYLKHVAPLIEDGVAGHLTLVRAQSDKFYLGGGKNREANEKTITPTLIRWLRSPKAASIPRRTRLAGAQRRARQRAAATAAKAAGHALPGLAVFDGKPVAKCMVCHLKWARANGWGGSLVSGFRSAAYSISLCFRICRRPSCPGTCAGATTNHTGQTCQRFAGDVSDYMKFRALMHECPCKPRIFNDLPHDLVHFSPNGH